MLTKGQKRLIKRQMELRGESYQTLSKNTGLASKTLWLALSENSTAGTSTATLSRLLPVLGLTMHIHAPAKKAKKDEPKP